MNGPDYTAPAPTCGVCGEPIHREELVIGDPQSVDWVHDEAELEMGHSAWPAREAVGAPKPAYFDEMTEAFKHDRPRFEALKAKYLREQLDDWGESIPNPREVDS